MILVKYNTATVTASRVILGNEQKILVLDQSFPEYLPEREDVVVRKHNRIAKLSGMKHRIQVGLHMTLRYYVNRREWEHRSKLVN